MPEAYHAFLKRTRDQQAQSPLMQALKRRLPMPEPRQDAPPSLRESVMRLFRGRPVRHPAPRHGGVRG